MDQLKRASLYVSMQLAMSQGLFESFLNHMMLFLLTPLKQPHKVVGGERDSHMGRLHLVITVLVCYSYSQILAVAATAAAAATSSRSS